MPLIIEEGYTSTLRKRLRSGEVDVIIVALPFNEPDVVVQPLYEEPFVLLTPEDHPLAKKKEIQHKDLDGENILMMGEGHCFRDQVIEALPNINQNPVKAAPIRTMTEGSSLGDALLYGRIGTGHYHSAPVCRHGCQLSWCSL